MTQAKNQDRIEYLAAEFDVFTEDELKDRLAEAKKRKNSELEPSIREEYVKGLNGDIIAIKTTINCLDVKKCSAKISVAEKTFVNMYMADPTEQKANLQWMLNTFRRLIKDGKKADAIRFSEEDLTMANEYLKLFEAHKRKQKFIQWCNTTEYRKWHNHNKELTDSDWKALAYNPSDINQYRSLSQLFDAVDPFIERSSSDLERAMQRFVSLGQAEIPFRDRNWTVYVPLTTDANCVMQNFASWCTTRPGNSMFNSYTKNNRKPNGKDSTIYVIVNNKMFTGESDECYQIHFETKQIKGRENGSNLKLRDLVLSKSEGVSEYFHEELDTMARALNTLDNNIYLDYLLEYGFTESLFDFLDSDLPLLKLQGRTISKLPDMTKFKEIDTLLLMKLDLEELHPSIGQLTKLELMSLSNNKLKTLPKEIGKLKNLNLLNLKGNHLEDIPDEIGELDATRGGKLFRISVSVKEIGEANLKKLKRLLPSAVISE